MDTNNTVFIILFCWELVVCKLVCVGVLHCRWRRCRIVEAFILHAWELFQLVFGQQYKIIHTNTLARLEVYAFAAIFAMHPANTANLYYTEHYSCKKAFYCLPWYQWVVVKPKPFPNENQF